MNKQTTYLIIIALLVGIICGGIMLRSQTVLGSAPSGLPASIASSSLELALGGGAQSILNANTTCASRIITSSSSPLRLSFGSTTLGSLTPTAGQFGTTSITATAGNVQAASTTLVYDSGLYGCGNWSVILTNGYTSEQVLVQETR